MNDSTARSRESDSLRQAFLWAVLPACLLALNAPNAITYGQVVVTTDITATTTAPLNLGTHVDVDSVGTTTLITGGTRPGSGTNLFHSFDSFTLGTGDVAHFLNDMQLPTNNIFARVVGGASTIDGTLRTNNPLNAADPMNFGAAHLWLVNPSGLLLGPNARVEVGGSVSLSTANYLRFEGTATLFDMLSTPASLGSLSVAPVVAFGFLGPELPAPITVQGSALSVLPGQSISLVGGQVVIQGDTLPDGTVQQQAHLSAPNGSILLGSAASPGEFSVDALQSLPNVDGVSGVSFTSFGSVSLRPTLISGSSIDVHGTSTVWIKGGQIVISVNDATLSTSQNPAPANTISLGTGSSIVTSSSGTDPGADVQITVRTLQMDGATVSTFNSGNQDGGNISINATRVGLTNGESILSSTGLDFSTGTVVGTGIGGNVTVQGLPGAASDAADLVTLSSASITTQTFGSGHGGNILVTSGAMKLDTAGAGINSNTFNSGNGDGVGGDITLNVGKLTLTDFALIQSLSGTFTLGFGQGGNVTIQGLGGVDSAAELVSLSSSSSLLSSTFGSGDGGGIAITSRSLMMDGNANIFSSTSGDGKGGVIDLGVLTADLLSGAHITSTTDFFGPTAGAGGIIKVHGLDGPGILANSLTLADPGSGIISKASGQGRLGNIEVRAKMVSLSKTAVIQAGDQQDTGETAGDVIIKADSVDISSGSHISSQVFGASAGSVTITAGQLTLDDGLIEASTSNVGQGGKVVLDVGSISLSNGAAINSKSLSADPGGGDAGQIVITTPTLTLDNAVITTSTSGIGNAGSITANVGTLTLTNVAEVSSSSTGTMSDAGKAGSITIQGLASLADAVTLTNSSLRTSADSTGRGGSITVDATNLTLNGATISASVKDANAADVTVGNIALTSSTLHMTGGTVTAATTGTRNAGTVSLNAASVNVANGTLTTSTSGTGNAGAITITATSGTVNLTNGSDVSSNSTGTLSGAGDAGSVTIEASGSFMSNGSKVSTSAENAKGGDIFIDANNVQLSNGTLISASSNAPFSITGDGNAGDITIASASNVVMQNSSVTTEASHASGGSIEIDAPNAVMLQLVNSRISTSVGGVADKSDGGNITIDPQFVILQNSQIIAQAFAGSGGAIKITATSAFIADPLSIVDASSTKGINGTVDIQSPLQNVGGELTALTQEFSSAAALLAQQCAARAVAGKFSTFVVAAREGLPGEPGGYLASPSLTAELLGSHLSGRNPHTQLSAVTGLFPKYDAGPIQLARFGEACHRQ